jgi:type I restriction enzyme S subunit
MAVWSEVSSSTIASHSGRIDSEYYRPEMLDAEVMVTKHQFELFGSLVENGYRVVYENTKILRGDRITTKACRFLQATNLSPNGLTIATDSVGYVSESDWVRYPKGRIVKGELLIEVKGQAEKVSIVPNDYPERTLVSGSLFKATLTDRVTPEFIFAFFNSRYGKLLRDRTKTNTLIAFVSKPELYKIPVPMPTDHVHELVTNHVQKSIKQNNHSHILFTQSQKLLETELDLKQLQLDQSKSFEVNFSDIVDSHRIDSQCFQPKHAMYDNFLKDKGKYDLLRNVVDGIVKGKQQSTSSKGDLSYVSIKDVDGFEIFSNESCVRENNTAITIRGALLLAITGATIGKIGIVSKADEIAFSGDLLAFKANKKINPYYLLAVMVSPVGQSQCIRWITGSTNGHLSPIDVSKFIIPRLSIDKENEIANLMFASLQAKDDSKEQLELAKLQIEKLIEGAI